MTVRPELNVNIFFVATKYILFALLVISVVNLTGLFCTVCSTCFVGVEGWGLKHGRNNLFCLSTGHLLIC